jgi:methionyl-tRNA formyltransferase
MDRMRVVRRLWRNRGSLYIFDRVLAGLFYSCYVPSGIVPFPDIDTRAIDEIRKACICLDCDDLHGSVALQFVTDLAPDYVLIAGAPVIRPALYGLARKATLNRHLGLAPTYRGSNCPIWALARGDLQSVGYTIHLVSERVDGGGIVRRASIPMRRDVSFAEYLAEVQLEGSNGFISVLSDILDGVPLRPIAQTAGGTHFPPAGLSTLRRAYRNYNRERQRRAGP